jgi:hypothetical protein
MLLTYSQPGKPIEGDTMLLLVAQLKDLLQVAQPKDHGEQQR